MVWGRMGLLDDAIREHLELKRLKGADLGDVAREEREALGEDGPAEQAGPGTNPENYNRVEVDSVGPEQDGEGQLTEPGGSLDQVSTGQETIELEMESVFEPDPSPAKHADSEGEAARAHARQTSDPEESLEWEMPADQELHESAGDSDEGPEDEPVEDVLEETPDFLRETPEQDRLWFEQRPPRDFDFNE
jgi:hypothetical protein